MKARFIRYAGAKVEMKRFWLYIFPRGKDCDISCLVIKSSSSGRKGVKQRRRSAVVLVATLAVVGEQAYTRRLENATPNNVTLTSEGVEGDE